MWNYLSQKKEQKYINKRQIYRDMGLKEIVDELSEFDPKQDEESYILGNEKRTFFLYEGNFTLKVRELLTEKVRMVKVLQRNRRNELAHALNRVMKAQDINPVEAESLVFYALIVKYTPDQEIKVVELIKNYMQN